MSYYYMQHGKPEVKKYILHGRTKQSQKNETDINKLLERSAREGGLSHLDKYKPVYGDFSDYDFQENTIKLAKAGTIFEELPAEIKREFNQSPQEFFEFVTNPENSERLPELLPKIANRGNYFPPVGQIQQRPQEPLETAPEKTEPTPPKLEQKPPEGE